MTFTIIFDNKRYHHTIAFMNINNCTSVISSQEAQMLEWDTLISYICDLCSTEPGKNYCSNIKPLCYNEILEQFQKLQTLKEILTIGRYPDFSGIYDITSLLEKASKGATLSLDEIYKVRSFLIAQYRIIAFFNSLHYSVQPLMDILNCHECPELFKLITSSITENGTLNDHTYPILRKLNNEINELRYTIEKTLNGIIHSPAYQSALQERIVALRNNRYVIPVRATQKHKIKGTILDISSSGVTLYIEPDSIHQMNNTLLYKELELQREIDKILQIISHVIGKHTEQLKENTNKIAYLDYCIAVARFSILYNANFPALSQSPYFSLVEARHPLLAILLDNAVVPCDIECGKTFHCLVISGVNTGGKTVLLKMIGLFSLMVRYGLPITASVNSTVGYFESIFVDIGDEQNIMQSLSTFSGQIKNIVRILQHANEKSLVIIDEIIVGTDPHQGVAIALAVLRYLVNKNATIAVTTHYSQLKEIASVDSRFQNASVVFDIATMRPTYRVITGIPGASYTIEIAKKLMLPPEIINEAIQHLDSTSRSTDALLSKVTEQSHILKQKEAEVSKLQDKLITLENDYSNKIAQLEQAIEMIKKEQATEFVKELQAYRDAIVKRIREIQSMSMKEATQLVQDITQFQHNLHRTVTSLQKPYQDHVPCTAQTAKKGDKVFIKPLQQYGIIEEIYEKTKQVRVQLGFIQSRFTFDDVLCLQQSAHSQSNKKVLNATNVNTDQFIPITLQTKYNTIDLRGLRVDEALQKIDFELDAMLRKNISTVIIIHGHGTGSLKKAIREYLKHSFYTMNYRRGEPEEGGDGVTIVKLR